MHVCVILFLLASSRNKCINNVTCSFLKAGAELGSEDDDESEDLINIKVSSSDEKVRFIYACTYACWYVFTYMHAYVPIFIQNLCELLNTVTMKVY